MPIADVPTRLYKYFPDKRIDFFELPCLRFTPIKELNDPFESQIAFMRGDDSQTGLIFDAMRIAQSMLHPFLDSFFQTGALSLSATHKNLLMWAHYSSNHTGFVLELDGTDSFFEKTDKVIYSESRLFFDEIGQSKKLKASLLYRNMFHKSIDWSYEEEWRIFKTLIHKLPVIKPDVSGLVECPVHIIKGIYLGLRSSEKLKIAAHNFCCSHPQIELHQANLHHSKYVLDFLPVSSTNIS